MWLVGKEAGFSPRGLAIRAPVAAERPARQLLARIPLSLADVHEPVGAESALQAPQQIAARARLVGPSAAVFHSGVASVDRHERRLAAHRQPDVPGAESRIDGARRIDDRLPLLLRVRLGDARRFGDPLHRHLVLEVDLALSTPPETGAALTGSGVHASGMCPSPASRPDVGSSPIQPAPGRYTSHHAWRSVKSWSAPTGPSMAFTSGTSWIRYPDTKRAAKPKMAQQLNEQPGRSRGTIPRPARALFRRPARRGRDGSRT